MRRGTFCRKPQKLELNVDGDTKQYMLASELMGEDRRLTVAARSRETNPSSGKEVAQSTQEMANLETILRELRDFHRENTDTLKEIKEELRETNSRIDNAETRIIEAERASATH